MPVNLIMSWIFSDEKIVMRDVAVNQQPLLDGPACGRHKPSICISPFSKAPLKQMVLEVVGSDGQNVQMFCWPGRVNTDIYQDILRQHMVPWVQRTNPDSKICLPAGFITGPHCKDHLANLDREHGRILDPCRLVSIVAGSEPAGLFNQSVLQEKVLLRRHASLATFFQSITQEWNHL
jgi:hypothetical protein